MGPTLSRADPEERSITTTFTGKGISNSGSGNIITRDIYIDSSLNANLLKDLAVTDPQFDKARIERSKGGLLKKSCKWILEHKDFRTWRDKSGSRQLWIKGDPGKGKTMLICGIIDELCESHGNAANITYFFCQNMNAELNTALSAIRSLIFLILNQQPELTSHLKQQYDQRGDQLFKDCNAWDTLSEIFQRILQDPGLRKTFIIIDALDECQEGLGLLLALFQSIHRSSNAKVLVSSRNWKEIERVLQLGPQKTRLSLELNDKEISAAVHSYISWKVDQLSCRMRYDEQLRLDVESYLMQYSNNTFLWVALVCQELADPKVETWETMEELRKFPPGLQALYQRMADEVSNSRHSGLCRQIIAIACSVYRPLYLAELKGLVTWPETFSYEMSALESMVGLCRSFLTLRDGEVHFIHQSAKDFFVQGARNESYTLNLKEQHHIIMEKSLEVLSKTLRRNIYELPEIGPWNREKPEIDPLALVRYSCVFWVNHLLEIDECQASLRDNGIVHSFLNSFFF